MIVVYNGTKEAVEAQMKCYHDTLDGQLEDQISVYAVCVCCGAVLRGTTEKEYERIREEMRQNGRGTRI